MDQSGDSESVLNHRVLLPDGIVTPLILTSDGWLRWSEKGQRRLSVEKEVLGFSMDGPKIRIKALVEDRGGLRCFGSNGALTRKEFVFQPLSEESRALWCLKLRECIDLLGRPKRLFVLVNPFGGKRAGCKIYLDNVKPILEDAEIDVTMQETKYQRHAEEVAYSLDLTKYDGIVCVSGDGILVEVINGLLRRDDWADAIKMPLGVVPAGTGNGMAKSLLHLTGDPCTACNATLAIVRGHKCSLDVATISQGEAKHFTVLMLAWGLVADIDIESEKYRWMGSARLDFYALQRIISLRHYKGGISFVPAPGFEDYGEPTRYDYETASVVEVDKSDGEPINIQRHGYEGPNINLKDLDWRKFDGPFISVWLHNVPWGAENTLAAPDAKMSDGFLDLIIIRDCPKLSLLSLMTQLNNGKHVKSPFVTYIKVKAFILKPGTRVKEPSKEGIIDVDGEILAFGRGTLTTNQKTLMNYDKLQISVHQGLATLFSPCRN
ncbi:sphingosine kinase 1 isoform X1 [Benincasa hispida]|uniref:sphingosine kinase 1 isoform X1 n=2 Tax=Benincasa hispida TaxID=102211 RepID=UPI001900AEFC|nr:sphingosine kinase 1 isoform X1 [Benincasa hispida]